MGLLGDWIDGGRAGEFPVIVKTGGGWLGGDWSCFGRATSGKSPRACARSGGRGSGACRCLGRSGERQPGRQPVEVFRVPDPAEPRFRPQRPARHPARYHVLLLVPALHIARGFPPVAQHILNQIGAQKRHIERRGNIQTVKASSPSRRLSSATDILRMPPFAAMGIVSGFVRSPFLAPRVR